MTLTSPTPPNYFVMNTLPPLDGQYVSREEWHGLYANGIVITNVVHHYFTASFPPPPLCASQVHTFGSTVDMEVSTDGGLTFNPYSAPGTVTVGITNPCPGWQTVMLQRGPDPASPTNVCVIWNSNTSGQQGTTNDLQGEWGTLEAIAFALDDVTDTGPYVLYLDNIVNGGITNPPIVVEDFENAPAGTTDHTFRVPGFSGTTTPFLMTVPNEAVVSNDAADTGTKSLRVQFQWVSLATNNWLRLTTYQAPRGHPNPLVNLNDPISFRILLLPPGSSPTPPARPTLSASLVNGTVVLTWPGGHNLQTAAVVTGPYTNATIGTSPVTLAPYTNTYPEAQRFFRLAN